MKAKNVHVGERYAMTISGKRAIVIVTDSYDAHADRHVVVRNEATGRTIILRSARRLKYNVTLRDRAVAYYAALAAGREPVDYSNARGTISGDFDGCQDAIDRARRFYELKKSDRYVAPADDRREDHERSEWFPPAGS
jgi:hypothetical protein